MLSLHRFDSDVLKNETEMIHKCPSYLYVPVIYLLVFAEVT